MSEERVVYLVKRAFRRLPHPHVGPSHEVVGACLSQDEASAWVDRLNEEAREKSLGLPGDKPCWWVEVPVLGG